MSNTELLQANALLSRRLWVAPMRLSPCFLILYSMSCVAPVLWNAPATPPQRHNFVMPHGVPDAYGGGVCAMEEKHSHKYPPVPKAAFQDLDGYARDTRPMYPYFDPHLQRRRSCFRSGWHLHLEPPAKALLYDGELDVYREQKGLPLRQFSAPHPGTKCEPWDCAVKAPHGHRACPSVQAPNGGADEAKGL